MKKTKERFDATGVVRDFKAQEHRATFFLALGKLMVPCHINDPAGTEPRNGERVRVIGVWIVDRHNLLCVEVHMIAPERMVA